jgi:integrase
MPRRRTGIEMKHQTRCATRSGSRRCTCRPTYQAEVWSSRDGRKIRRRFAAEASAIAWQAEARYSLGRGRLRAAPSNTLRGAGDVLLAGMESGAIRNRSGDVYKPSVIRGYRQALRSHVLPDLGGAKLADLRHADLQALADRLLAAGLNPSTIKNAFLPVRVIYKRALRDGEVAVNPTTPLELPAHRGRRDRVASPAEAAELIQAVPDGDRTLWATAFYSGLRRGELLALRWENVDHTTGAIRVDSSLDLQFGEVAPKSSAGRRYVPMAHTLRGFLLEHRVATASARLVFTSRTGRHFDPPSVQARADKAWSTAKLKRITLHEARHTYASLMIAAGVPLEELCEYMGHSSITVTRDLYGHLLPDARIRAAELLDAYLVGT